MTTNNLSKPPISSIEPSAHGYEIAFEPDLIPPLHLMSQEGINVLEEWFRWSEEWSMLLRLYGKIANDSNVLEIGCGLGRIAFPLRYILSAEGSYKGFEICKNKVDFLKSTFHQAYPNFYFFWANLYNTHYNPEGRLEACNYEFPSSDNEIDLVYAASVFTHMLPSTTKHYFKETARVLRPGGRAVFSFFLLDYYYSGQKRPFDFNEKCFNFDYSYKEYGDLFAIVSPQDPEQMTAYRFELLKQFAAEVQLSIVQEPLPGMWSGTSKNWVGTQDLLVLEKPDFHDI